MRILHGDSLEVLKTLKPSSVDAVVTDPPYGLAFMGKKWDYDVPSTDLWREVWRVLKPGGHLLSFGGTRTYHRMAVAIEDAGFEIRDQLAWNFGSGFPKSHDVYKTCLKKGLVCECPSDGQLPNLRKAYSQVEVLAQADQDGDLQLSMQRSIPGSGLGPARSQGSGRMVGEDQARVCQENSRAGQPMLARRGDVQAEQGQLHRPEVCSVSREIQGDGSQGRVHNGTPPSDGDAFGPDVNANGSCTSQGSQHEKQSHTKSAAVPEQPSTQACGRCGKAVVQKGLGTALKPAFEPIVLARKPLEKGLTVAENVLKWGTGALAIDACRIGFRDEKDKARVNDPVDGTKGYRHHAAAMTGGIKRMDAGSPLGRFPANVLLDEEAAAALDEQSGTLTSGKPGNSKASAGRSKNKVGAFGVGEVPLTGFGDSGGASRFFYVAKASKRERGEGNVHPTVKPIKLMEYLCKLICPPGGVILDPFLGSGTTGCAAVKLGYEFIGIEREAEYVGIATKRIEHWQGDFPSQEAG